jgi:hypothetical protein
VLEAMPDDKNDPERVNPGQKRANPARGVAVLAQLGQNTV